MSNSQGLKRLINLIKHQYNFQVTVFKIRYFHFGLSSKATIAHYLLYKTQKKLSERITFKVRKTTIFLIIDQIFVQECSFESDIGLKNWLFHLVFSVEITGLGITCLRKQLSSFNTFQAWKTKISFYYWSVDGWRVQSLC